MCKRIKTKNELEHNDGKVVLSRHNLKALRRQYGLSQENLAHLLTEVKLGVSIATVKRAETGKVVNYSTAYKLAKFYNVEVLEILLDATIVGGSRSLCNRPPVASFFKNSTKKEDEK